MSQQKTTTSFRERHYISVGTNMTLDKEHNSLVKTCRPKIQVVCFFHSMRREIKSVLHLSGWPIAFEMATAADLA